MTETLCTVDLMSGALAAFAVLLAPARLGRSFREWQDAVARMPAAPHWRTIWLVSTAVATAHVATWIGAFVLNVTVRPGGPLVPSSAFSLLPLLLSVPIWGTLGAVLTRWLPVTVSAIAIAALPYAVSLAALYSMSTSWYSGLPVYTASALITTVPTLTAAASKALVWGALGVLAAALLTRRAIVTGAAVLGLACAGLIWLNVGNATATLFSPDQAACTTEGDVRICVPAAYAPALPAMHRFTTEGLAGLPPAMRPTSLTDPDLPASATPGVGLAMGPTFGPTQPSFLPHRAEYLWRLGALTLEQSCHPTAPGRTQGQALLVWLTAHDLLNEPAPMGFPDPKLDQSYATDAVAAQSALDEGGGPARLASILQAWCR